LKRVTHLFIGASIGLLYCNAPELCVFYVGASAAGAYLPDFDLHYRHRKLLHNIFAVFLFTFISWIVLKRINLGIIPDENIIWKSFALGYLSHLLLDILTPRGVFILYPFSNKPLSAGIFKSNSLLANTLFILASITIILWKTYELVGEKLFSTILGSLL
jgi:inner membrane protein